MIDNIMNWLVTYFMSGVRPIELSIQFALSEQAPTYKLYTQFCMAELLQKFRSPYTFSSLTASIIVSFFILPAEIR